MEQWTRTLSRMTSVHIAASADWFGLPFYFGSRYEMLTYTFGDRVPIVAAKRKIEPLHTIIIANYLHKIYDAFAILLCFANDTKNAHTHAHQKIDRNGSHFLIVYVLVRHLLNLWFDTFSSPRSKVSVQMECVSFCTEMTRIFQAFQAKEWQKVADNAGRGERERGWKSEEFQRNLAIQCASIFVSWLLSAIKRYKAYSRISNNNKEEITNARKDDAQGICHTLEWKSFHTPWYTWTLYMYIVKIKPRQQYANVEKSSDRAVLFTEVFFVLFAYRKCEHLPVCQVYCLFFMRKNP